MKRKAATFHFTFRTLTWLVFVMYACILIKMILFKRPPGYYLQHFFHNYDWGMIKANFRRANLVPFTTIMLFIKSKLSMRDIVGNVLGNIVGFIPFGILVPMLFRRFSTLVRESPANPCSDKTVAIPYLYAELIAIQHIG